jgi:vancomycin resistance protein YoaR
MMLDDLIEKMATEFKTDPRNSTFVSESMLLASVAEEVGKQISTVELREVIAAYLNGEMDETQEVIYDGAIYASGLAARHCFSDDPEDDIDYEIDWQEQNDGSYLAEVSPN